VERFAAFAFEEPDRQDYIDAAEVRNMCRKRGVQIGTIDALLIQLARRHDLAILTTDQDFRLAAAHVPFRLWSAID
jgi:predicted nucleic acid-binding protein